MQWMKGVPPPPGLDFSQPEPPPTYLEKPPTKKRIVTKTCKPTSADDKHKATFPNLMNRQQTIDGTVIRALVQSDQNSHNPIGTNHNEAHYNRMDENTRTTLRTIQF